MVQRSTVIAVLVGLEAALVVMMIVAIRGTGIWHTFGPRTAGAAGPTSSAYHFAANANTALTVAIGDADLQIDTAPGPQITVVMGEHGFSIGHLAPLSANEVNNVVHVTSEDPDGAGFVGIDKRLVRITVPPATHVTVEYAGDTVAAGLRAPASFNSPNGYIDVHDFRGELSATSSNGHVNIVDANCISLHVTSSNGHVGLHHVSAERIEAVSSNGRIEGTALELGNGRVSSSNGRVSLGFARGADTTVTAAASNGNVHVNGLAIAPVAGALPKNVGVVNKNATRPNNARAVPRHARTRRNLWRDWKRKSASLN